MSHSPVPEAFAHLCNLAADEIGTFVVWASDDYFAPKENLLRSDTPVWKEGEYTDRGKWMDGWESQRMRGPGHDAAILRLGAAGTIEGIVCDTTHFKGNAPQAVSLEVCATSHTATPAELLALPMAKDAAEQAASGGAAWLEVLPHSDVRADFPNVLLLPAATPRATHVRLRIYPDGGVARLRVYGRAVAEPRTFWQPAAIDLVALEHGGGVASVSDQFFGPPSNLLLPGRGVNMGDGWETKRRRTPGSDWCVLRLGRRGVIQRVEIDTHFFKGNAPQATSILAFDAGADFAERADLDAGVPLRTDDGWTPVLDQAPLVQHRRHVFEPARPTIATHLRVHIFPHGGVNRMRVYGVATDTPAEAAKLAALHAMDAEARATLLRSFCASERWVMAMQHALPTRSVRGLFAAADDAFAELQDDDWLQAFAAHPRIGNPAKAATATAQSATWSSGEQAGVGGAPVDVKARLADGNDAYFNRFGFIFICFATGRSAAQMLDILERRIRNDRATEIANAGAEQSRITRLRVEKWLLAAG